MKYENINILGNYTLENGGTIHFSMGDNIKFDSEFGTYIHELAHMYLTNSTNLGFLLLLIKKEYEHALYENDYIHSNKLNSILELVFNRTIYVQEVFANNIELLWVEKNLGKESRIKLYNSKPIEYKEYSDALNCITNNTDLNYEDKKHLIEQICMYALNIPIISEDFINSLNSLSKLNIYFKDNHPKSRLNIAINNYLQNNCVPISSEFNIDDLLKQLTINDILKYTKINIPSSNVLLKKFTSNGKIDSKKLGLFAVNYQKQMEEKIKLFDVSSFKAPRINNFKDFIKSGVFLLKNVENMHNNDFFYAITHISRENYIEYISTEISNDISEIEEFLNFIVISYFEYNFKVMEPKYFKTTLPTIIIIEDYSVAKEVIQKIYRYGELIIGDLYDDKVSNFYTMIFFKERTRPNQIFVFPTLKKLSLRLIGQLRLEKSVLYSNDDDFKKILSTFKNETNMLEFIEWIFAFILNSKSDFTNTNNPVTKMTFGVVKSLFNSVLHIKNKEHFELLSALPTLKTNANPFYCLMTFDNKNVNTGNFYAHENNIILFSSKSLANKFSNFQKDSTLRVVGLDKFYWNMVKVQFKKTDIVFALCQDRNLKKAKILSFEELDLIINNY